MSFLGVVILIGGSAFGYGLWRGQQVIERTHGPVVSLAAPLLSSGDAKRGQRWVDGVVRCGECHGPDLGGKVVVDSGIGRIAAPNITSGEGSAVSGYGPSDWIRAIRHGVDPSGRGLWLLPAARFRQIADVDLADIIAYLQRARPVDRASVPSQLTWFGKTLVGYGRLPLIAADEPMDPVVRHRPASTDTVAYGGYLITVAGCADCHGRGLQGGVSMAPLPPALVKGRAASWSETQWRALMQTGVRPDGTEVDDSVMPVRDYMALSDEEIDAMRAFVAASSAGL